MEDKSEFQQHNSNSDRHSSRLNGDREWPRSPVEHLLQCGNIIMSWLSTIVSPPPSQFSETTPEAFGDWDIEDPLYPELADCDDRLSEAQLIDDALASVSANQPLLGQTLLQAGLINRHQIDVAVVDGRFRTDLRIGEILAIRGWIAQETADFFAEHLHRLSGERPKLPIGQYFKAAKLLTQEQIDQILDVQRENSLRFGETAVNLQFIKRQTLVFMLGYLL